MSSIQNVVNRSAETMLHSVSSGATASLFAKNLMTLNPVHAAGLSAVSVLVSKVTSPLFQMLFGGPEANGSSLFLGNALNITLSVAATVITANAIGFSISVASFLYISAVNISTYVLVSLGILAASAEVVSLENSFMR